MNYEVSFVDNPEHLPNDVKELYFSLKEDTQDFTLDMQDYANACADAGIPLDFLMQEDKQLAQLIEQYTQDNTAAPSASPPTNRTQLENLIASTELAISYENDETMRQRLQKLIENTKLTIAYL